MAIRKILSIDGGGIRGVIPAMVLARVEELTGKRVYELFDLVAGTSTGGILALALTKPKDDDKTKAQYGAADLVQMYEEEGKNIFSTNIWHKLHSLWGVDEEKYPSNGIEGVLQKYFGKSVLSEALTDVLVTSYEIETRTPFFFKSRDAKNPAKKVGDYMMWQAARATSAAPTYFEPFKLETKNAVDYYALIDGGVFANNPGMCAYAEACKNFPETDTFMVFSVGTGEMTERYDYNHVKEWGLVQWAIPILNIVFDGVSKTVDYQLDKLLDDDRYFRFEADLASIGKDSMDNASESNIHALKLVAQSLIDEKEKSGEMQRLCELLLKK